MLPSTAFSDVQQATQFSSWLPPPLELANKCSTLASVFESGFLQKKHSPPCANSNRSKGLIASFTFYSSVLCEAPNRRELDHYQQRLKNVSDGCRTSSTGDNLSQYSISPASQNEKHAPSTLGRGVSSFPICHLPMKASSNQLAALAAET
jgi:hypothetical protein